MTPRTQLGVTLAAWAEEAGTLEALATYIGVQSRTLSRLIAGASSPSPETVARIATFSAVTEGSVWQWHRNAASGLAFPSPRRRGGLARGVRLSPERRREIARSGWYARAATLQRGQMMLPMGV